MIGEEPVGRLSRRRVRAAIDDELAIVRAIQGDLDAADLDEVNDAYTESVSPRSTASTTWCPATTSRWTPSTTCATKLDEDLVKIYLASNPAHDVFVVDAAGALRPTPPVPEGARVEPVYVPDDVAAQEWSSGEEPEDAEDEAAEVEEPAEPESRAAAEPPAPTPPAQVPAAEAPVTEPDQPSLVDAEPAPPPRKPSRKGRRASVPSWDEIMFGSPKPRE